MCWVRAHLVSSQFRESTKITFVALLSAMAMARKGHNQSGHFGLIDVQSETGNTVG